MHMLLCISVHLFPTNACPQSIVQNWRHFNPSWEHISHVTVKQSVLVWKIFTHHQFISVMQLQRNPKKLEKELSRGLSPSYWSTSELYCTPSLFVCYVLLLTLSGQEVSAFCISPVSFCDDINHTPMFCPFFFSFCFLFLHLSWACSAVFLPCLSLAVLWQLLKGCLSWGTDPRTKTRPRPSTGAPCVRSPLAVMLIFHCLHSLPSCQYGDNPQEKSLISAVLQYETGRNYFRFLSQLLNSG